MGTYYIGLSMAGTVSAGTFTGGTLAEINTWLSAWQEARSKGVVLKALKATANYNIGDSINITPAEIPNHFVKIKALSGASGGGVSAALLLAGLSLGKVDELLREVWQAFDVRDMLDNNDLSGNKPVYSLLNVKPIEMLMEKLLNERWGTTDNAKESDYLDDNIELFLTLASYEGIPFKTARSGGNSVSYGIHKTHLDYIKFNFSKNGTDAPNKPGLPFAHNLVFRKNQLIKDDNSWLQLILSCPATAAFPIGFKPRSLKRYRNEYTGKLFYLNYANPSDRIDYALLEPAWPDAGGNNEPFDMEYIDGGTFNREPHDLARASVIESLDLPGKQMAKNGAEANASVILIDPFPSNFDIQKEPGSVVEGLPSLFHQPQLILAAMMNQGRFRPDWIEKALDDEYYSRYLISPVRKDNLHNMLQPALAGGLLGAFSGFIDISFREHDYKLGHYNTYQFLNNYFVVPTNNLQVDYCNIQDKALLEKYEALGWYMPAKNAGEKDHCQVIPRMIDPNIINSLQQPVWPVITEDKWAAVYDLVIERGKEFCDAITDFNWVGEKIADPLIWNIILKSRVRKIIESMEKELVASKLLRKIN